MIKSLLCIAALLLLAKGTRQLAKPSSKSIVNAAKTSTREGRVQISKLIGILGHPIEALLYCGALYQAYTALVPLLPQADFVVTEGSGPSPEVLRLSVSNTSPYFSIKNAHLDCYLDLIFFEDQDGKGGIVRDLKFHGGLITIQRDVSYSCDPRQFVWLSPSGSLVDGFLHGQIMSTIPGAFRPPMKIIKLCVEVSGDYSVLGVRRPFKSALFQWPNEPGGSDWVKGPIAYDNDQTKWMPTNIKELHAWGLRRILPLPPAGPRDTMPTALRCDWEGAPPRVLGFTDGRRNLGGSYEVNRP